MSSVTRAVESTLSRPGAPPFSARRGDGWTVYVDETPTAAEAFAYSVARGLSSHPRWLHCRYLYDATGSQIFSEITRQPEYYLTDAERTILETNADAIRAAVGPLPIMELGAGTAEKTRQLLEAWSRADGTVEYLPLDIDATVLGDAVRSVSSTIEGVSATGLATSYERGVELIRHHDPLCMIFLGSSIGNFNTEETDRFLQRLQRNLTAGDAFLLGVDLVKDTTALEAAYNDAAGASERFTRNLFRRMNREFGSNISIESIQHVAYWNDRLERIEIYARFEKETTIELPAIGRSFRIAPGEMVLTEISRKYHLHKIEADLARFGFELETTFTDPDERFGLLLSRRRRPAERPADWTPLAMDLHAARSRTLGIVDGLEDDDLRRQVTPILSPILWDLEHIAEFEALWLVRALDPSGSQDGLPTDFDAIATPRSERGGLSLPGREDVLRHLRSIRREALAHLRKVDLAPESGLASGGFAYRLVTQHEYQHQETILQAISLMDDVVYEPAVRQRTPRPLLLPDTEMVIVPGGAFAIGSEDPLDYDNERPVQWMEIPAFWIDTAPVSNAAFQTFIERGGYLRREWWCDEGWRWRSAHAVTQPARWRSTAGGWRVEAFGRTRPLISTNPVQHVSWYEASAYARSVDKRLPSEVEWEKAAAWDPEVRIQRRYPWGDTIPTERHANLDANTFSPAPVGAYPKGRSFYGCHQMLGDVWEWTSSEFSGYPGFEPHPYPEYSEAHFDRGYRVLRGGSWATASQVARCTFRNWDLPERRQIFAGFRCARDA